MMRYMQGLTRLKRHLTPHILTIFSTSNISVFTDLDRDIRRNCFGLRIHTFSCALWNLSYDLLDRPCHRSTVVLHWYTSTYVVID